mmetsp:Transcript_26554/g.106326  ORF Transcript_26554/g.106326 Transcript_26554/m.106326 type:complete len:85 (-) Transcript_26554:913-1167(-)
MPPLDGRTDGRTNTRAPLKVYEAANAQLQTNLELAHDRIAALERENGTLALALARLRAEARSTSAGGDDGHARRASPGATTPPP